VLVVATFMATRNANQVSEPSKAAQPTEAKPAEKAKADPPASKPADKKATASAADRSSARHTRHVRHRLSTSAAVTRAIEKHKVVVLAFFQPGADDRATAEAVRSLRHRHLASVYTDRIDHIGRYGAVVGDLGIHQAPAIVIVDSKRHARLVEGYVDPESLAQEVSDAHK
jgi:pyruvate/2-oxoglutarate dehydrogenase complex dihydrolipoamide acyltransferase (E2) component